jgi:hypothetical protein
VAGAAWDAGISHACARLLAAKGELDCAVARPIPAKARTASGAAVDKKRFEGMNGTLGSKEIDFTLTFGLPALKKC